MKSAPLYGGIEAGGSKFVCGIGTGNGELVSRTEIETTTPEETILQVADFFKKQPKLKAIGIGSFGPVNIDQKSPSYGTILHSPKPGWASVNLYQAMHHRLQIPVKLQTDTDVAAIGEHYHGKALDTKSFLFVTIGTGVGGSIYVDGSLLRGYSNSEMGHVHIPFPSAFKKVQNQCTVHEDCLEGYVSGRSLNLIYGNNPTQLKNEEAWALESRLIAVGLTNMLMVLPVERVILGGGVMKQAGLIEQIRKDLQFTINGYIEIPDINTFVVHASSDTIGVLGAIKLATL